MVEHLLSTHKAPGSILCTSSVFSVGTGGGWAGDVAQLEESLPGMSKVLVLTPPPLAPHTSGMLSNDCNLSVQEVRARRKIGSLKTSLLGLRTPQV